MGIMSRNNSVNLSPHLSFCRIKESATFDHPLFIVHTAVSPLSNVCVFILHRFLEG